ncbi:MAG: hypothetical protein EON60_00965 [Alphaproteobacteria bacterium]|nr:MAG: hypothetical protein EON60_00965 [Alphaproteobacteria bacterium]
MTNATAVMTVATPAHAPPGLREQRLLAQTALGGVKIDRGPLRKHAIAPLAARVKRLGNDVGNRWWLTGDHELVLEFGAALEALENHARDGLTLDGRNAITHVIAKANRLLELYD